jgi:hypothetical protein
MKKLLVVLLALTLFGVVAFAQDAEATVKPVGTFTAWNEGIAYLYDKQGDADATTGWGPNWNTVTGIDQEWSFGYSGNNYGFSGTLEFGMDNFGNNSDAADSYGATISWFNTYYKFADVVQLQLGKLHVGDYRAAGGLIESQFVRRIANSEFGALLQLLPIGGFSAGVFAQIPQGGAQVSDYGDNLGFGVAYDMPDMLNVKLTYRTIDSVFNGGVSVTALKPVTIVVGFQNEAENDTTFVYGSVGGKVMDALTVNLDAAYKSATTDAYGVEVQGEYAFGGQYAVGVRVGYDDGNGVGLIGNGDAIYSNGGLFLFPYVVSNFDNGSYVKLGVAYSSGDTGDVPLDSRFQIPLVYVWSF